MEPDMITELESLRFQSSRWQQLHPISLGSVPLMDKWMPQLVTDSRSKPADPQKMQPILKRPTQSIGGASCRNAVISQVEVKTSHNKNVGIQQLNGALKPRGIRIARESTSNRKPRNVLGDQGPPKKDVAETIRLYGKQGNVPIGNEDNYDEDETFSGDLPNYMKPLNRSVSTRTEVIDQPKGNLLGQPSAKKKTWTTLLPSKAPNKDKQSYYKTELLLSSNNQVKVNKVPGRSVNVKKLRKAQILNVPPCSPVGHQNMWEREPVDEVFGPVKSADSFLFPHASNVSYEMSRQATSSQIDVADNEILESGQSTVSCHQTELSFPQMSCAIANIKPQIEVKISKSKKKSVSVNAKRLSFLSKKPSMVTPTKSHPKTRGIQNRPYHGAVADPLKGELPPNGNLQCKPEGMKNFISMIGMPFYDLPVSQPTQYSDAYLDMLEEAGIPLRKTIRESVKQANKKLQDPKPWMPSRLACLPRRRPVSPQEFTRKPRSPETMVWKQAADDLVIEKNTKVNQKLTKPPIQREINMGKQSPARGSKKNMFRVERKAREKNVTGVLRKGDERMRANKIAVGDSIESTNSNARQAAASRIMALMERSVVCDQCSCDAAKRVDSLVTQNIRLRNEVRQLERLIIEKRNSEQLRGGPRTDLSRQRNSW